MCSIEQRVSDNDPGDDKYQFHDSERTRCEVYSRVMGYHRPVSAWNIGKKQEFADRKYFSHDAPLV